MPFATADGKEFLLQLKLACSIAFVDSKLLFDEISERNSKSSFQNVFRLRVVYCSWLLFGSHMYDDINSWCFDQKHCLGVFVWEEVHGGFLVCIACHSCLPFDIGWLVPSIKRRSLISECLTI